MRFSIRRTALAWLALGLTCAGAVSTAHAGEPFPARARRAFTPGRNAASDDGSDAGVTNPATPAPHPAAGARGTTAGLTWRPSGVVGFAAVAHDFNGPSVANITNSGLPVLDRSFVLAMALRPGGTRAFELGAEMKYLDGSQQWMPKVTLGVDVPGVG